MGKKKNRGKKGGGNNNKSSTKPTIAANANDAVVTNNTTPNNTTTLDDNISVDTDRASNKDTSLLLLKQKELNVTKPRLNNISSIPPSTTTIMPSSISIPSAEDLNNIIDTPLPSFSGIFTSSEENDNEVETEVHDNNNPRDNNVETPPKDNLSGGNNNNVDKVVVDREVSSSPAAGR